MIYAHFLHFCKKNSHTLPTDRPVILKGYEKLSNLELIIPAKKSRNILGKVFMEYQLFNLNLTDEQVNEGLKLNMELTKDLKDWAFTR